MIPLSASTKNSQIYLHSVAHSVILEGQLILERSFSLPLQHDLMGLPPDLRSHVGFKQLWDSVSTGTVKKNGGEPYLSDPRPDI